MKVKARLSGCGEAVWKVCRSCLEGKTEQSAGYGEAVSEVSRVYEDGVMRVCERLSGRCGDAIWSEWGDSLICVRSLSARYGEVVKCRKTVFKI